MHFSKFLAASAIALGASAQNNNNNQGLTDLLSSQDNLSALVNLLQQYPDLTSALGNMNDITLFAPNNQAIQALLQSGQLDNASPEAVASILMYHVIPSGRIPASDITTSPLFPHTALTNESYTNVTDGQVVKVQATQNGSVIITSGLEMRSTVVQPNLRYNNGIVHVIDSVLTIPRNISATAVAGDLTSLAGALIDTDLLTTLDDLPNDVTVFAPTNEAFQAIGGTIGNLSTSALANILQYHVVNGTAAYSRYLGNGTVTTLNGQKLNITVEDNAIFVNSARVVNADVLVENGVIHIIDAVLNPNGTAAPNPSNTNPAVQFSSASSGSLTITSGVPMASTTASGITMENPNQGSGIPTRTGGGAVGSGAPGGNGNNNNAGGSSSSSSGIAPGVTGMVGAAALFGGAAMMANF